MYFADAAIKGDVSFDGAVVSGKVSFFNAVIDGDLSFWHATIDDSASFIDATIEQRAIFDETTIGGVARFQGAHFNSWLAFDRATFKSGVSLIDVVIGDEFFLRGTTIEKWANLDGIQIKDLIYAEGIRGAPEARETVYRKAKQMWGAVGDRDKEDFYFYCEMVAKRERKKPSFGFRDAIRGCTAKTLIGSANEKGPHH